MRTIDPYHKWLGIPPKHQPPNHYRLLGLELFEDNRSVIATVADRQMGFIKSYQTGPPEAEELSQRILNELVAARICLLNPRQKAAYDLGLQSKLERKQAEAALSVTERLPRGDLSGQSENSAMTAPVAPTSDQPAMSPVPTDASLPTTRRNPGLSPSPSPLASGASCSPVC